MTAAHELHELHRFVTFCTHDHCQKKFAQMSHICSSYILYIMVLCSFKSHILNVVSNTGPHRARQHSKMGYLCMSLYVYKCLHKRLKT